MEGLLPEFYRLIESCGNNTRTINQYMNSMRNEISVSQNYKKITIKAKVYTASIIINRLLVVYTTGKTYII